MAAATNISLREWIKCGSKCSTTSVSINGSCCGRDAVSRDYLLASLKVAISLCDDINNAEDLARIGFSDGLKMLPQQFLNGSMPDWAEFITVRVADNPGWIDNDEQEAKRTNSTIPTEPMSYSTFTEPRSSSMLVLDGSELQALSDDFLHDYADSSGVPSTVTGSNKVNELVQNHDELRYLNVDSANIAVTQKGSNYCEEIVCSDSVRDRQQRIYLLGLVFYELFSGGDRPPPELLVGPASFFKPNAAAAKEASASHAFDFARTLNFLDDSVVDEEGDFFNVRGNSVVGSEESLTRDPSGSCYGFVSRKKQSTVQNSLRHSEHFQGEIENGLELCKVTTRAAIEELKLKGVPESLCNMIYYMIDCINGDFRGDQSYSNISDVTSDLRLMEEQPQKFLQDMDVNTLSLTPLTLNATIFDRNDEFESLQCAYSNSASGSPEIALIAGESGTGKTWLADRLGRFITSIGGVFLEGKFDRLKQAQPLSVLAGAFNAYCNVLIQETNRERAKFMALKLQEAFGQDACPLVKVIPNLGEIISFRENDYDSDANQDCKDAQKRLYYLMCRFVETISSCSDCMIALFLDDLQWADDVSLSIVEEILKSPDANKRFFFLGCYRDEEIENGHPFGKMIENVQGLGITTRIVKLECMDEDMATRMLSNLLCLSPRLVRPLSDIVYHRTKGNPLFFSQFILSLNRDGLLYLSLTHRRWQWDEDKIWSRGLPDDVAVLFTQRINRLSAEVKSALYTLSCFGSSVDIDVIKELEASFGDKLIDHLVVAEKEGFVTKTNSKYVFAHDRIQEAAYSMTAAEERCFHHMKYGLSLAEVSSNVKGNNSMLFVAVGQINLGGPSAISNYEQRLKIVKYNLAAGKVAIDMSEFHSAYNFFDNGITFLKKTHWRDHYNLSLELYELAAKCALIIGDMFSLTVLTDQVTKNACCFEDTLNISYICMSTLEYASKISDSFEMGLEILSKLGEALPRSFPDDSIELEIKTVQAMLEKTGVIASLNDRMMTDEKKIMAMKFLRRLYLVSQQVNPSLLPVVTLKMIKLTIEFGMSRLSPIGFAFFGSLVAKLGDIKGGYKFTCLAKSLVDRMNLRDIAGEVLCVSTEIMCFIEPLHIANENRKEAEATALAAGDVTWACYSRAMYASSIFWSGAKLLISAEAMTQGRRFALSRGHVTSDNYLLLSQQSILKLIGPSESETITDDDLKQRVFDSNNPQVLSTYYFKNVYTSFVLDDYDCMKQFVIEFFKCPGKSWMLMSNHIFHVLIGGLVSFRIYRETKLSSWLEQGKKFKLQMKLWAEQGSSWTFENKHFLLEAEENFSDNKSDVARSFYDKAISSAKAHKLVHEEAIAYELAAKFYFFMSEFSISLDYCTAAHEKYCEWGAYAKANSLSEFIQEKLTSCLGAALVSQNSFPDGVEVFERQRFISKVDKRKRKEQ